jgi:hypothetical protein
MRGLFVSDARIAKPELVREGAVYQASLPAPE